jgi:hypothetical protein
MGFGFLYHVMFQYNPDPFKINPMSGDVRLLDAISEHQKALENLRNAEQVVIATVAGLRSEVGRQSLTDLADALPDDEVRTTFVSCLSLAVVGPPRRLTPQQFKQLERIQGTPGLAEELKKAEEEVAKTSPEFLMPVPYWPRIRELQRYQPYNMKVMIEKWLEPIQAKQSGSLKDYATEEDSRRLSEYLKDALHLKLPGNEKVDLLAASTPIRIVGFHEKAALEVGAQKWERLTDLIYFSFMTISTVGYGDILPNSTSARAVVTGEVIWGIVILVFFATEFLRD